MIRAVYKGVMKAVARQLSDRISSDMKRGDYLPLESYLMSAEAFAYEELCKAFKVNGSPVHLESLAQLEGFAQMVVNQMGQGRVEKKEYLHDGISDTFVGIIMPNKIWMITWCPVFMSAFSPRHNPTSYLMRPCRRLSVVLPDLDRMMPVLERMTRNILNDLKENKKC